MPERPLKNPTTQVSRQSLARVERNVDEIIRILRGSNGDLGIIADIKTLAKEIHDHIEAETTCPIKDVTVLLYGHKTDLEKRGLVNDIDELRKWKDKLDHWYLVMIGAIIVGIINAALQIFFH